MNQEKIIENLQAKLNEQQQNFDLEKKLITSRQEQELKDLRHSIKDLEIVLQQKEKM